MYQLQQHAGFRSFCFLACPTQLLPAHSCKWKANLQALSRVCPWKHTVSEMTEVVRGRNTHSCVCVCVCENTPAHLRAQFCNPRKLRSKFALSLRTVLTVCAALTAAVMGQARDWIQLKNNPTKISNNLLPGVWAPWSRSLARSHTRTYTGIGPTLSLEVAP